MIGKPYSGKLNVRFDEGELEIEPRYYASSLLYPLPQLHGGAFLTGQKPYHRLRRIG